jgi:sodium transport system permease protein
VRLDARAVATLFSTEIRMLLRDRRTVLASIVLPLAVTPILLFASHWMEQRREHALERTVYVYAVTGQRAAMARDLIEGALAHRDEAATSRPPLEVKEKRVADPARALEDGDLQFYLDVTSASEPDAAPDHDSGTRRASHAAADEPTPRAGEPVVTVVFRGDRDDSRAGAERMVALLKEARGQRRDALLAHQGSSASSTDLLPLSTHEIATAGHVAGLTLGRVITLLLLLFILSGGAVVATDSLAGEKERGTLETLLTTSVGRLEIVPGSSSPSSP